MGGFHFSLNFMGSVGMLMKGSGVEDILVQTGICHLGTANKIMSGKDYYLILLAHSLLYSAIMEFYWEAFEDWLLPQHLDTHAVSDLNSCLSELVQTIREGKPITTACEHAQQALENISPILDELKRSPSCNTPTAKVWIMYMNMIQILQSYIYAERVGNCRLHLQENRNMLPYLVSAGHHKYVSCLPHCLSEKDKLQQTVPEVHKQFMAGHFGVR